MVRDAGHPPQPLGDETALLAFRERVWQAGREHYRDLPWRRTDDAWAVLVSEVMLQQTQAPRVAGRWERFMELFPTPGALAAAPLEAVLHEWQGLGYNRRAVALKRAAEAIVERHGGAVPSDLEALLALPGVGPATAAGVRAFAFGEPGIYLETNVRAVFLHELFADAEGVPDSVIAPLVERTVDQQDPRGWYWALLDYGAHLKRTLPNPSRRSAHHAKQSRFEGSRRQKRAALVRAVLAEPGGRTEDYAVWLSEREVAAGRPALSTADVLGLLEQLAEEGFLARRGDRWTVA